MDKFEVSDALQQIGVDPLFVIRESFLGYKYRKREKKLYDGDSEIPTKLIRLYYGLNNDRADFDTLQKAFVTHYINQESKLEGIDIKNIHSKAEIEGLGVMYEYIHSEDIDYMFNVYTLKDLHKRLFSKTEFPECAGDFRNWDVYLPGTGTEISEWSMIRPRLESLEPEIQLLLEETKKIKQFGNVEDILNFIDRCVVLKCKLIKVHPFGDGNGRTVRGFINKLFEYAGLPPIYIKENERTEYHKAMNKANNDGDYKDIINFYKYKICDSIVELDINHRVKKEKEKRL